MKENQKILLICAGAIYGVIMFASLIVYFMMPYVVPQTAVAAAETEVADSDPSRPLTQEEILKKNAEDMAKADKQRAEDEEKAAAEREKKKEQAKKNEEKVKEKNAATWGKNKHFRELVSGMKETVRGSVTFYTHNYDEKPPSGIYIRPFVIQGKTDAILKNDVYYFVSLDDPAYGWIHGDTLEINADGQIILWTFDPAKRHDKLGKGAESITESYVETASNARINDLKTIGNATNVTVYYSLGGGNGRSAKLSRENLRRIRDMLELYEIFAKDMQKDTEKKEQKQ